MKNTIIWGFDSISARIAINSLKEKNIIDIKMWVGDAPECTHDIHTFFVGDFKKSNYKGNGPGIYDEIFKSSIHQFMDMMSRHSFYVEMSFHDHLNIYNMLFDLFSDALVSNNIDVVLFINLPHEGPDFILYKIARKLNIKTIIFYQTIFPEKFFYFFDVDDFGKFADIKSGNKNPGLKIEKQYEKDLFYMVDKKQYKYDFFSLSRHSFRGLLYSSSHSLFKKENYMMLKGFFQKRLKHKASDNNSVVTTKITDNNNQPFHSLRIFIVLIKDLFIRSIGFSKRFCRRFSNYRESKKNLRNILSNEIDLNKKYVYFPLHLQPELTTSTLGDIYVDQLLAIERLSKLIPENWYIYVKENPKQTDLMRGKWFFARLRLINHVRVASPDFNTYLLMKNCAFVTTITGTAGWEAISGGKNALIFGNPWYKCLPGVFLYTNDFKLEDILKYEIDHSKLENELNLLLCKTGNGVIDESYSVLVEKYNVNDNATKIQAFIEVLLT